MNKTAVKIVVAFIVTIGVAANPQASASPTTVKPPAAVASISASTTEQIQRKLHSYGYTIQVDGDYGTQTTRIVGLWQKANGMTADGIAGAATLKSLGLSPGASVKRTPVTPTQTVQEPPPTPPAPSASGGSDCDEMSSYRQAVGLPEIFDHLGKRESNCTNTPISNTGCCVGYWQLHKIIFRDNRMIPLVEACGATWLNIRGDDTDSKQRQACVAKALYDTVGMSPWAL